MASDADNDGTISIGDKYVCEVKENTPYTFYVLSIDTNNSINLIMERNICSNGNVATAENTCLVAWYDIGGEASSSNGPVTAMNYLNEATSSWENISPYKEGTAYDDEEGHFSNFSIAGYRARLPYKREVADPSLDNSNHFLYEYLDVKNWDTSLYGTKPTNNLEGISGYWIFSSFYMMPAAGAIRVDAVLGLGSYYPTIPFGVRPVITISTSSVE